jgi:hypothetical protein
LENSTIDRRIWNRRFEQNAERCCRNVSQCCRITSVRTLPPTPLKASANWNFRCWSTVRIILIWQFVWPTQRRYERPPFHQWLRSERSVACVAFHSTKIIFFLWAGGDIITF